jgi:hypothetical protein
MNVEDKSPSATEQANRGAPATGTSGAATGSGSGAGGSGAPEDYDTDPKGGGGSLVQPTAGDRPDSGGDAPQGGMR